MGAEVVPYEEEPKSLAIARASDSSRAIEEVRVKMLMAKRFPRDTIDAQKRISVACQRPSLAEVAMYSYKRGGQEVTGPSIHLATALAQNWGNIDCGVNELERAAGESIVEAYAHDLETNFRKAIRFAVPHMRHTKQGAYPLTDPRDIYEMVMNNGARRLRACLLAVIPGDVVDAAEEMCKKTLEKGAKSKPLADQVRDMAVAFGELGVTQADLEGFLGHTLDRTQTSELQKLRGAYTMLRDDPGSRETIFPYETKTQDSTEEVNKKLGVK